jgi:hypothetical protein
VFFNAIMPSYASNKGKEMETLEEYWRIWFPFRNKYGFSS